MACATGEFYIAIGCVEIWRRTRLQEIEERERGKAITNRSFNAVASRTRLSENAIIEIEGISSRG